MRLNNSSFLGIVTAPMLLLVLAANPALSYQSQGLQSNESLPSTSGLLVAERGCDGISVAKIRLQDALYRLRGVEQGSYIRAARESVNTALSQLSQAQRNRRC